MSGPILTPDSYLLSPSRIHTTSRSYFPRPINTFAISISRICIQRSYPALGSSRELSQYKPDQEQSQCSGTDLPEAVNALRRQAVLWRRRETSEPVS